MTDALVSNESKTSVFHDLQSVQSNQRCPLVMTDGDEQNDSTRFQRWHIDNEATVSTTIRHDGKDLADAEGVGLVSFECGTLLRVAGASWNQFYETCQPGPSQPQISSLFANFRHFGAHNFVDG